MTKQNLTDLLFLFPILLLFVGLPASHHWDFEIPVIVLVAAPLVVLLLWILCLFDIAKLTDEGKNGALIVWFLIVFLAPVIGAYAYYLYELRRKWFPYPPGHPALLPLEEEKCAEPVSPYNSSQSLRD